MRTARPVCSTKAIGESPCGRIRGMPGRSSRRAIPQARCLCGSRWWRTSPGRFCASTSVTVTGTGWKEYKFEMQSGNAARVLREPSRDDHRPARDAVAQLVSLFPPTYHGRPNGNRIDIMEKLAAMRPAFLRFPGGNYLEGNRIETRFDWKKMIGPLVDRPTHPTTWSYHSTDGMGLLEFLEWCEDLHMQPLLGIYAGYSLGGQVVKPGPDLDPYVQEGLEEIEYVTGGTDTKWGAVRARDGHPAPFTLRYVEIGNEDNFDRARTYDGRYAQFYKAIKAKYPNSAGDRHHAGERHDSRCGGRPLLQARAGNVRGSAPLRQNRPQWAEDLRRRMGHAGRHADSELRRRPGRRRVPDRPGTEQRRGRDVGIRAVVRQCQSRRDAVELRPDRLRCPEQLRIAELLRAGDVRFVPGRSHADSSASGAGDKFFYSVTASPDKVCLKLVNASSTEQPLTIALNGHRRGDAYCSHRDAEGEHDLGDEHHHASRAHRAREIHRDHQGRATAACDARLLDSGSANRSEVDMRNKTCLALLLAAAGSRRAPTLARAAGPGRPTTVTGLDANFEEADHESTQGLLREWPPQT